jgi:hypothetical protein
MAEQRAGEGPQMSTEDFLLKDYELKVQYLTNHFSRMWTRFNFFLTINSALFAFSVQQDTAAFASLFVVAGILLSILWYFFGAADNYLVEVYRRQVGTTYYLLGSRTPGLRELQSDETMREVYSYAGDTKTKFFDQENTVEPIQEIEGNPLQWRLHPDWRFGGWEIKTISATELAPILPFVFLLLWIARLCAL